MKNTLLTSLLALPLLSLVGCGGGVTLGKYTNALQLEPLYKKVVDTSTALSATALPSTAVDPAKTVYNAFFLAGALNVDTQLAAIDKDFKTIDDATKADLACNAAAGTAVTEGFVTLWDGTKFTETLSCKVTSDTSELYYKGTSAKFAALKYFTVATPAAGATLMYAVTADNATGTYTVWWLGYLKTTGELAGLKVDYDGTNKTVSIKYADSAALDATTAKKDSTVLSCGIQWDITKDGAFALGYSVLTADNACATESVTKPFKLEDLTVGTATATITLDEKLTAVAKTNAAHRTPATDETGTAADTATFLVPAKLSATAPTTAAAALTVRDKLRFLFSALTAA